MKNNGNYKTDVPGKEPPHQGLNLRFPIRFHRLKLEAARIFAHRGHLLFLVSFVLLSVSTVYSGASLHKDRLREGIRFDARERHRVISAPAGAAGSLGVPGLNIRYQPSVLSIFFSPRGDTLHGHIHITAPLEIHKANGLPRITPGADYFNGAVGIFFLLGSLFMVYMGLTSHQSNPYFFDFRNILLRLMLLDTFFMALLHGLPPLARGAGLAISRAQGEIFFYFSLYMLCFLSFFYGVGLLIRLLSGDTRRALVRVFLFWLLSVPVIPGALTAAMERNIHQYRTLTMLYPPLFLNVLGSDAAGTGYRGYTTLAAEGAMLRDQLLRAHRAGGAPAVREKLNTLVEDDRHMLPAGGFLPPFFFPALGLAALYTVGLLGISRRRIRAATATAAGLPVPDYPFRPGNTYFVLCKNDQYRDALFRRYQQMGGTPGLDRVIADGTDPGVGPRHLFHYLCRISGADPQRARAHLAILGIPDLPAPPSPTPPDLVPKIHCAAATAAKGDIVYVNEFLEGKTEELETRFLQLAAHLNGEGKTVVYLGKKMFSTALPFGGDIRPVSYRSFKIDPRSVSLR